MDLCYSCGTCRHLCNRSDRNVFKKHEENREAMRDLQGAIKVGARIMFAGGIYGKIVKIKTM